ncbi:MAG: Spy/CpxP family protein refolding chaperone [Armatimonadetes bacterium]|nr:Spy/CpxP family protein refolding chaperone [Armatimonadota bacterium]
MKRLLILSLLAVSTASLLAQAPGPKAGAPGQGGAGGHGEKMNRMGQMEKEILSKLNLTADQKKQIAALQKQLKPKREALMAQMKDAKGDRTKMQALRPQFQALRKEHEEGLMKILTPAQQKQFKDAIAQWMKDHPRPGGGAGGGGGRPGPGGAGGPGGGN